MRHAPCSNQHVSELAFQLVSISASQHFSFLFPLVAECAVGQYLCGSLFPLPSVWTVGISAITSVTSPGRLWTSRWLPSSATLSRMLERPRRSPVPPPSVLFSGLKPGPQSRTCRRTVPFRRRSVIYLLSGPYRPPHLRQRIASKTSQPSWSMEPKNTHPSRQKKQSRSACSAYVWLASPDAA